MPGPAEAHAAAPAVRYACEGRESLVVARDARSARVDVADRSYDLVRKRSSIGVKYLSPTAALIIDGPAAIFVAEDRLHLGSCAQAVPLASAR